MFFRLFIVNERKVGSPGKAGGWAAAAAAASAAGLRPGNVKFDFFGLTIEISAISNLDLENYTAGTQVVRSLCMTPVYAGAGGVPGGVLSLGLAH